MRVRRHGLGAVLLVAMTAIAAEAQVCVGVPLDVGQTSVALNAGFLDDANAFGARAANRLSEPLTLGASYSLTTFGERLNRPDSHAVGIDAALRVPAAALEEIGAGLCAVAGVSMAFQDDFNTLVVPLGVAIGGPIEISEGLALVPYVVPQFVWQRASYDDGSFTFSDFGVRGGANLLINNLFFGASINKIENSDAVLGINAGIVF